MLFADDVAVGRDQRRDCGEGIRMTESDGRSGNVSQQTDDRMPVHE